MTLYKFNSLCLYKHAYRVDHHLLRSELPRPSCQQQRVINLSRPRPPLSLLRTQRGQDRMTWGQTEPQEIEGNLHQNFHPRGENKKHLHKVCTCMSVLCLLASVVHEIDWTNFSHYGYTNTIDCLLYLYTHSD